MKGYILVATIALVISVSGCSKNEKPKACFTSEQTQESWAVSFNSSCSENADSYLWIFGDGDSSTTPNPVHIFEYTTPYTVTLQVTNSNGTDAFDMLVSPKVNCVTCVNQGNESKLCDNRSEINDFVSYYEGAGWTCGEITQE